MPRSRQCWRLRKWTGPLSINVREFLLRVLPWPGDDLPGFCNVHAMMHNDDGSTPWTGTPTRDVDGFLQEVHRMMTWRTPPDIYFCLSRQAKTKPGKTNPNKLVAAKHTADALALKAIWYDVDVGKEGGYADVATAMAAVLKMCVTEGLPAPTAWVASGGGLHAYWISDRALTPDEWHPYASGLKALALKHKLLGKGDYGVTTDAARVLRVPGTYNLKQATPRPVKLLGMKDHDYDMATALAKLSAIAPTAMPGPQATPVLAGKPSALFAQIPVESLAEGVRSRETAPLEPHNIVKNCGWFREALTTGGKDFSQGLWNLSALAATFLENGHALAHKMARGHPGYSHGETEALWDRKVSERQDRHLGYPSCRAIQGEGCSHCATCPVLALAKSPLNLARVSPVQPVAAPVAPFMGVPATPSLPGGMAPTQLIPVTTADMPAGFVVDQGIICKIVDIKDPGLAPNTVLLPIFHCTLYNAWAQAHPDALNFIASVDKGSFHAACIPMLEMTTTDVERACLRNRVKPVAANQRYLKEFIMSWLAKLHAANAAQTCAPFGWHIDVAGVVKGFSYGGILYGTNGLQSPAGAIDPVLKDMYAPKGSADPWIDAFKLITDQKRPGLETIVAASFASTLMYGSGEYVGMISVYGDTGAGKTSAMRVATAVWGNPKLAKENEGATEKSVLHRLGQLRNLPYMWDEIKDENAQAKVFTIAYRSGGKDNGRLTQQVEQRKVGTWENIVVIASNPSFCNYVLTKNPDTAAGLVRVFEYKETKPSKKAPGQIRGSDAGRVLRLLDDNYGEMGKRWAMFIATNRDLCYQKVKAETHWFEDAVNDPDLNTNEERFWISICAALQSAAELANVHLGLNFDAVALRKFLVEKYREQRAGAREDHAEGGSADWTEDLLTAFLKAYHRSTLRTESIYMGAGKIPTIGYLIPLPETGYPVHIQWTTNPGTLLFSQREFYEWVRRQKSETRLVKHGLMKHFGATFGRATLGAGTTYREGQEMLISLPVPPGTALWRLMTGSPDPGPVTAAVTSDITLMVANPDAKNAQAGA